MLTVQALTSESRLRLHSPTVPKTYNATLQGKARSHTDFVSVSLTDALKQLEH